MINNTKVGVLLDDKLLSNIDFSCPEKGNPGVGGTQYLNVCLAYLLSRNENMEIFLLHTGNNIYPKKLNTILLEKLEDINQEIIDLKIEKLVFSTLNSKIISIVEKLSINVFYWSHNFIFGQDLKNLKKTKNLVIVFSSINQRNRYIDHEIFNKSIVIKNPIWSPEIKLEVTYKKDIVFIGNLINYKGFHLLAKIWGKVLKSHPDAHLHVIGSGNLYDNNAKLGELGLAEINYEKKFLKYLNRLTTYDFHNSITFHGKLGIEKFDLLRKCNIGVFNPKLKDEVYPTTITEMNFAGIYVIAGKTFGVNEIIRNGENGFILTKKKMLYKVLNRELSEIYKFDEFKKNEIQSSITKNDIDIIKNNWELTILNKKSDLKYSIDYSLRFMRIRKLNYLFKKYIISTWPSIVFFESQLRNFSKIMRKIFH